MTDGERRCPLYGGHAVMTAQVMHDHWQGDAFGGHTDCGVLYNCPECGFSEWAGMYCDGEDDDDEEDG